MRVAEVNAEVQRIRSIAGDDEMAHAAEDDLHQSVLEFIAKNAPDKLASICREALRTKDIPFARWCA